MVASSITIRIIAMNTKLIETQTTILKATVGRPDGNIGP